MPETQARLRAKTGDAHSLLRQALANRERRGTQR